MKKETFLFATGNKNKLEEIKEITGLTLESVDIDLPEIQSVDGRIVVEEKAKTAYKLLGKPALVEDTSLEFNAWNKLPGALIRWFLDTVGPEGILNMMKESQDRTATAKTFISYYDGAQIHTFTGEVSGSIAENISKEKGFGWDVIFIPQDYEKTFSEMSSEEKNSMSMRKKACGALLEHLEQR